METIRNTYTDDGENTCLAVKVHGPPNEVKWLKDGQPLEDDKKYTSRLNQKTGLYELVIHDTVPSDSGEYRCVATNSKGHDSCPIKLDIQPLSGPPKFLRALRDAEVLSDTCVKFIVEVVGSPTPQVRWFKDGEPLENSEKYVIECKGITYCLTVKNCVVSSFCVLNMYSDFLLSWSYVNEEYCLSWYKFCFLFKQQYEKLCLIDV